MKVKRSKKGRHGIFEKAVDENNYDAQGRMVYKGRLAQQKTFSELIKQSGSSSFREADLKINEDMEMLDELMELYGVDKTEPNYWFSLAYSLANEHVPCFSFKGRPKKKGGRPKKWDEKTNVILVNQVKNIIDEHSNFSAKDACRILIKNGLYGQSLDGLYTRYMEAKKNK